MVARAQCRYWTEFRRYGSSTPLGTETESRKTPAGGQLRNVTSRSGGLRLRIGRRPPRGGAPHRTEARRSHPCRADHVSGPNRECCLRSACRRQKGGHRVEAWGPTPNHLGPACGRVFDVPHLRQRDRAHSGPRRLARPAPSGSSTGSRSSTTSSAPSSRISTRSVAAGPRPAPRYTRHIPTTIVQAHP